MEVLKAVLIHLVTPAVGVCIYLAICRQMYVSKIEKPPYIPLFLIFGTLGGWLMIFLTLFFWYWSGMAALGAMGLIAVAPIVMIAMAIYLFSQRRISTYHYISYIASIVCIAIPIVLVTYGISTSK